MSTSRHSTFRDALQVSRERIAAMGDVELDELMRELLLAHAHRCGSSVSEVRVNTEGKAKDDGCDGWTAKPGQDDEWLGAERTCWQLKAGVAGTPGAIKGEVTKPIPRDTLMGGGRFVVVAAASTNGKKGEEDRLKILRDEAQAAGIPTANIEVIGSERLAVWSNLHPAVAARWAGRPEGMWTLSDWAAADVHQVPWQASEMLDADLARLRALIDFTGGTELHLHIHGPPGVGKTRLALELCRGAPWRGSVIYIQQAEDVRLLELVDSAAGDAGVQLVVAADEVQPEQLRPLRESVGRADGRIRLITIGHCSTPDPARIPGFAVTPLDGEMSRAVVKGWHPAMPPEHVDFVTRFADGYVRLARLAADAVSLNTTIDVRGLLDRHEIRGFLDGMLGDGERRSLYVVAALRSVGWTDDKKDEGEAIAKHLGLDWNDVRARVDDFHRRLGIAPRGGRYRYISPTPLGIHLAVEAWTTYPDLLRTLPEVLPSEGAKDAYYDRLRSIASNPQAREYAREELSFFFRLGDFVDARAVRRWSALSAADPDQAARNLLSVLQKTGVEERAKIEEGARREVVWTLVRLAWRSTSFVDSVKALALLAEAENERWANNATAEFLGRYQVFLGGTSVPYLKRLSVLDELLEEHRPALSRLVVRALARVGEERAFRMSTEPPTDEVPDREWNPSTGSEHFECVRAALQRLTSIAGSASPELEGEFVTAGDGLSMMLREAPVRPLVVGFFDAVRAAYPNAREPLRRAVAEVLRRARKRWKELPVEDVAELEALHARFEDASLAARLRQTVGQAGWDREDQPDLKPLAEELLNTEGALSEAWPWLTSGDAADAWRLGEALAEADTAKVIADTVASFGVPGRDLRFLCGYVSTCRRQLGDAWYDQWLDAQVQQVQRPIELLFEVAWRCGATESVARHLAAALARGSVPPGIAGQLEYGRWADELSDEILEEILRALVSAGHSSTALTILEYRTKASDANIERWRPLALELVLMPALIRSGHMTEYHWKELALRLVEQNPSEIATAIIREQADRTSGRWFVEHSEAALVLDACVAVAPDAVWAAIVARLTSPIAGHSLSIGFPAGIITRVGPEQVMRWVDADPEERPATVVRLVGKNLASDDTLPARLLGAYGDRDDVGGAFFGEYVSGSWTGPASEHWERLADSAEAVSKRTALPKLRRWAADAARRLREMAARDRQREEEEEIRGR